MVVAISVLQISATMTNLTPKQLQDLRNAIFDNAESLRDEAKTLFDARFYARSFLLSCLCFEELGKLALLMQAVLLAKDQKRIDWTSAIRKFTRQTDKLKAEIRHHYRYGTVPSLSNVGVAKLNAKLQQVNFVFEKKDKSTYVGIRDSVIENPLNAVTRSDAERALETALDSLKAHWVSENTQNPKIRQIRRQ